MALTHVLYQSGPAPGRQRRRGWLGNDIVMKPEACSETAGPWFRLLSGRRKRGVGARAFTVPLPLRTIEDTSPPLPPHTHSRTQNVHLVICRSDSYPYTERALGRVPFEFSHPCSASLVVLSSRTDLISWRADDYLRSGVLFISGFRV